MGFDLSEEFDAGFAGLAGAEGVEFWAAATPAASSNISKILILIFYRRSYAVVPFPGRASLRRQSRRVSLRVLVRFAECIEAAAGSFQLRIAAAFLLNEIVFDSADTFRSMEDSFPICFAFSE